MIEYRKYKLDNGLTVITHEAWDTPMASVNLLYNVGARNESAERTGFAHLFEHLMFSGTRRVPDFDAVVTDLGGESNAMTNNDFTDYYITLPAEHLGEALFLEADRMSDLVVSKKALEVQQKVVTEEYNQRYINQPYGDVWLLLRPLCYKVHPYRWATIGADIRHVSEATLEDVQHFHSKHYRSDNAVLAVAAPMAHEAMIKQVESAWRSTASVIDNEPDEKPMARQFNVVEPCQMERRELSVKRNVPTSRVILAYPMCDHFAPLFRACDLLTDVLCNGQSSRLHKRLVKELRMMTDVDAYVTGDASQGLLVLNGKLCDDVAPAEGMEALRSEAMRLTENEVDEYELRKVVNKFESTFVFSQYKAADRTLSLNINTWLGNTEWANSEPAEYAKLTPDDLLSAARATFVPEHENCLYYLSDNQFSEV